MNMLCFSIIHKNKFFCLIFLLLFSLMSVYMPHSLVENSEQHIYETTFNFIINNNKPIINLRNLHEKLKSFISKLFRMTLILLNRGVLAAILINMFIMRLGRFSKESIHHAFLFLCFKIKK
ncbi:hypothetical protein Desaci_1848 [Desulfosporosinus acidiphilus SJ4]|uniref:Uncharacterized protein n=1 Tax=Desulfosporosinus acidiphilus (strain DSM 22704 / JCM 16185 / SJ4) TaxID=646529 RepID=I4D4V4_DESAJ|nr:hypothetical protein Desaci_1848 [Desulfosporosinus acidiphilus SJ4]